MIIPEEHVVGSRYDPLTGTCHYVVEQDGKRYTVSIKRADLDRHPTSPEGNNMRRNHLIRAIAERLKGEPDPDPSPAPSREQEITMSFNGQADRFPLYQSHKLVKAQKIQTVYGTDPTCVGLEPDGVSFTFTPSGKPTPQVGWYCVCYEDGYVSFSPPETFEAGHTKVEPAA